MSIDPLDALIDCAACTAFRALPEPVIEHQKRRIADSIACMAAGAWAAGTSELLDVLASGRNAGCLVIGRSGRMAPREAAMQNSLAARALDLCDVIAPDYHLSSTDVPTALAMAAHCGSTGQEVIEALAVAQDVACRIALATVSEGGSFGGFDANALAPLSGALVAGKLLKLSARRLREAVGLTANTSAGSLPAVRDGVLAARFSQAYATRSGVESALLAERGVTNVHPLLSGPRSLPQLFAGWRIDTAQLHQDLGSSWFGPAHTCFKPYPLESSYQHQDESRVEIELKESAPLSHQTVYRHDCPQNPPTKEDQHLKLQQCLVFAGLPEPERKSHAVMKTIDQLDTEGSLRRLLTSLEELAWLPERDRSTKPPRLLS